jgi:hypothetical protein
MCCAVLCCALPCAPHSQVRMADPKSDTKLSKKDEEEARRVAAAAAKAETPSAADTGKPSNALLTKKSSGYGVVVWCGVV